MTNPVNDSRTSRLKDFLESSPIRLIATVVISTASVVAGGVIFVDNQKIELINRQHESQIAASDTMHEQELAEATDSLKKIIDDLNFRVSSIERRLPNVGPSYLDITTIMITQESEKFLDSRYTEFGNDDFYLAVPNSDDWIFSKTNDYDLNCGMMPEFGKIFEPNAPDKILENLKSSELFLWKNKNTFSVTTKGKNRGLFSKFFFSSFISIQKVDETFIKQRAVSIENFLSDSDEKPTANDDVIDDSIIHSQLVDSNQVSTTTPLEDGKAYTESARKSVESKDKVMSFLENLYSDDIASFVAMDSIGNQFGRSSIWKVKVRVVSAQKKGNVFYLQTRITFPEAEIKLNNDDKNTIVSEFYINEELFFLSSRNKGYLIRVMIPYANNRSSDFLWVSRWLAGLQIPLDS